LRRLRKLIFGAALVILLAGGDKRTQDRDITTARALARAL